ncbi:MAG: hypothetical protein KC416_01480 [Myxococcales bacterium]|nr:hypothetical protein [Myxococcales bacterium]
MAKKDRLTDSGVAFLLLLGATLSAFVVLFLPRGVEPSEVAGLHLDAEAVDAQLAKDRANAKKALATEEDKALNALFREAGTLEFEGARPFDDYQGDRRKRSEAVSDFVEKRGEEALLAHRAAVAEGIVQAITGQLPADRARETMGRFVEGMRRANMATEEHILAPTFMIRTAAKVRWNIVFNRDRTEGLTPIEEQAYYGWLALHVHSLAPKDRLAALQMFRKAGGKVAPGTEATLRFLAGDAKAALDGFRQAYDETGSVRFRNHMLAAERLATAP